MIAEGRIFPGINRALYLVLPLVCAAAMGLGYALYALLLSPASIIATLGAQENYYWTVARFQIAALSAERQMLLYESGKLPDFDAVVSRFDVLESRYALMARRSDSTDMLAALPSFGPTMQRLGADLERMGPLILSLQTKPASLDKLVPLFEHIKSDSGQLAFDIGDAEVAHRDRVYADFQKKRRNIFIASVSVTILAAVLGALAYLYEKSRRVFSAQQSAALAAEQRANRAAAEAIHAKNAFLGAVGHEREQAVAGFGQRMGTVR